MSLIFCDTCDGFLVHWVGASIQKFCFALSRAKRDDFMSVFVFACVEDIAIQAELFEVVG